MEAGTWSCPHPVLRFTTGEGREEKGPCENRPRPSPGRPVMLSCAARQMQRWSCVIRGTHTYTHPSPRTGEEWTVSSKSEKDCTEVCLEEFTLELLSMRLKELQLPFGLSFTYPPHPQRQ